MSSTSLTLGNMIAAVVQWAILLVILRVTVYKPLLAAMNKRRESIAKQIQDAESLREEAMKLREESRQLVERAKEEAKVVMATLRREADEQAKEIVTAAQREAEWRQRAALEEIQHEKDVAVSAIRDQVSDLVMMATQKLLERNLTQEDQHQLIEGFLRDTEPVQ